MKLASILTVLGIGILTAPAMAIPQLEIHSGTSDFENVELLDGDITVSIDYTEYDRMSSEDNNLGYELMYQGKPYKSVDTFALLFASFQLRDLDSDGVSEVIVQNYSGGAHCCTNTTIHRWDGTQFVTAETGFLDGLGVSFDDLDEDGQTELIMYDQAFLYQFGSYAESYPPEIILTYQDGNLVDMTHQYPERIRAQAADVKETFLEVEAEYGIVSNALLTSYVALNSQIGSFDEAWQFMLDNYDREMDWGLTIYDETGEVVGYHPDFPTALQQFLIETGYLNASGEPVQVSRFQFD
ncbi:MAG: hypothetical protein AAFR42_12820 [Cyanobacteria bacterium J06628_6]